MKKWLCFALAGVLLLGCTACGGEPASSVDTGADISSTTTTTTTTQATSSTTTGQQEATTTGVPDKTTAVQSSTVSSVTTGKTTPAPTGSTTQKTTATQSHTPVPAFEYEKIENGITITKYIGTDKNVIIPATINGMPVTQIGNDAFFMNKDVVSVVMSNTVVKIGVAAFERCVALTAVTLSTTIKEIGGGAFQDCTKLKGITLPNTLTSLGGAAFRNCTSLKSITIPSNCRMGIEAFYKSGLESVVFADGISLIPDTCFAGTNIREVILPKTVKTVDRQAFADCKNLEKVVLNKGLETVGDLAFYGAGKLKEVVIPPTVTNILESSFSNCPVLDKLKFEGNAPNNFLRIFQGVHFEPVNANYTVCYHEGAAGFTSPEWNGYPTEIW